MRFTCARLNPTLPTSGDWTANSSSSDSACSKCSSAASNFQNAPDWSAPRARWLRELRKRTSFLSLSLSSFWSSTARVCNDDSSSAAARLHLAGVTQPFRVELLGVGQPAPVIGTRRVELDQRGETLFGVGQSRGGLAAAMIVNKYFAERVQQPGAEPLMFAVGRLGSQQVVVNLQCGLVGVDGQVEFAHLLVGFAQANVGVTLIGLVLAAFAGETRQCSVIFDGRFQQVAAERFHAETEKLLALTQFFEMS